MPATQRAQRHDETAAALYSSLAKLSRQLRNIELPSGITPQRLSTLASINAHGPISVKALATMENVSPATMSRLISALAENGLVNRREDNTDRRGVLVSATAKGRRVYGRANQQCLRQLGDALTQLEPKQLEMLRRLAAMLEELTDALSH